VNGRHSSTRSPETIAVADPRNPGDEFLQQEIDRDRLHERVLIPKTLVALAIVAALIVVRQVFLL
jgi:hypothetical protein